MRIKHVTLHTTALQYQQVFYHELLGFPLVKADATSFTLQAGESTLTFRKSYDGAHIHHFAFNIPAQQFEEAIEWALERVDLLPYHGQPYLDFSESSWDARALYFYDAGGNIVELIGRKRYIPHTVPSQFSMASVQCLSEIGLASPNMPIMRQALRQRLGLDVFGYNHDEFTAIGGDDGLLILVALGRVWLPTAHSVSGLYPIELELVGQTAQDFTLAELPYTFHVCTE